MTLRGKINSGYYEFDCGCKFPISDYKKEIDDGLPSLDINFNEISLSCPATWQLMCDGKVTGCFQLETQLGKSWVKKVQPLNEEDIAAVVSLLRPSCTQAFVDGKNMAQHYVDRKNGIEEYQNFHPEADETLNNTYGIILYQEQAILIARKFAGFNLKEADIFRKAIGKKSSELMQEVRIMFLEGCKKVGLINETKANDVFDIMQKAERFSFNLSHGIQYGIMSYWTAYVKAHFPLHFYTAWLAGSINKSDSEESVGDLVSDSKSFSIPVIGPSILKSSENFSIQDLTIRCGLGNIRGVGKSHLTSVYEEIGLAEKQLNKNIKDFSWFECVVYLLLNINKSVVSNMLASGCFSYLSMSRQLQMFEFNKIKGLKLTDTDLKKVKTLLQGNLFTNGYTLIEMLDYLASTTTKQSKLDKLISVKQSLLSPPNEVRDTEEWIANVEDHIIGASITCSKIDSCNTSSSNITCRQFNEAETAKNCIICGQITRLSEYQPKGGKMAGMTMAYITLLDATGPCEAVAFPNSYKDNSMMLFKGNTVMVTGNKSDKGSLIINKVEQI